MVFSLKTRLNLAISFPIWSAMRDKPLSTCPANVHGTSVPVMGAQTFPPLAAQIDGKQKKSCNTFACAKATPIFAVSPLRTFLIVAGNLHTNDEQQVSFAVSYPFPQRSSVDGNENWSIYHAKSNVFQNCRTRSERSPNTTSSLQRQHPDSKKTWRRTWTLKKIFSSRME